MIKRGDLIVCLRVQSTFNQLIVGKTYEVKQVAVDYVYVFLNKYESTFDRTRNFRLATKQEANRYLISKMFNNEV